MKKLILGIAALLLLSGCASTQPVLLFTDTTDLERCKIETAISDKRVKQFKDIDNVSDQEGIKIIDKLLYSTTQLFKYCPLPKKSKITINKNIEYMLKKREQLISY